MGLCVGGSVGEKLKFSLIYTLIWQNVALLLPNSCATIPPVQGSAGWTLFLGENTLECLLLTQDHS